MSECNEKQELFIVEKKVKKMEENFHLTDEQLTSIMNQMIQDMKNGLGKGTKEISSLKMIPSFVKHLPDGTERGSFLALDLGGSNFRVLLVTIREDDKMAGQHKIDMDSQVCKMPEDIITGEGEKLFDHIASCMADFLKRLGMLDQRLPVGFTFSFPVKQESLDNGTLMAWDKGFTASGVIGKDIVTMLREAIERRGDFKCDILSVVNDTVGTLMSCAHSHPQCKIGLIVGTGCNACYMEELFNIESVPEDKGSMCINMEWGAFGDNGTLEKYRNEYDVYVDEHSSNQGHQLYEKMIGGMYLGELVRLALCQLTKNGAIFSGTDSKALFIPENFESAYVSQIESAESGDTNAIQNILSSLDISALKGDCEVVIKTCQAVSRRASHLCAAGIAAVARKIKANHPELDNMRLTVGVDGTVYKKHPTFSKLMADKVRVLCAGAGVEVDFALSYDGSGKGAALITAAADRARATDMMVNGTC